MDEPSKASARRRDWTRREILSAAWDLATRRGLAELSLRELAAQVGMRAPSLYNYFPSKNDLYDAMYAQGMYEFTDALNASPVGRTARAALRNRARSFVRAAIANPVRFALLFQRPIPG